MIRRTLNILLSLLVAIFFLWLAFRQVHLADLVEELLSVKMWWILPFTGVLLASHYVRAERWRLLISGRKPPRTTLFAGVMLGYMANYLFPRLGELSRPVYVARQQAISSASLFGTIVIERLFDLISLVGVLLIVSFFFLQDDQIMDRLIGSGEWGTTLFLVIPAVLFFCLLLLWASLKLLNDLERKKRVTHPLLLWIVRFANRFWSGLASIKEVKAWPLFLFYTVVIWFGYVVMTWLPFYMLDLQHLYGLGMREAMIITVVAAVGITIPTPGGAGSYHLLVQQSLWLLYAVPLSTALTYATITHAVTLVLIVLAGAFVLWFDKYYTLKKKLNR